MRLFCSIYRRTLEIRNKNCRRNRNGLVGRCPCPWNTCWRFVCLYIFKRISRFTPTEKRNPVSEVDLKIIRKRLWRLVGHCLSTLIVVGCFDTCNATLWHNFMTMRYVNMFNIIPLARKKNAIFKILEKEKLFQHYVQQKCIVAQFFKHSWLDSISNKSFDFCKNIQQMTNTLKLCSATY